MSAALKGCATPTFYLLATVVFTWPLVLTPSSQLVAPVGAGDPYLNLWILGWGMGTVLTAPVNVLNGRVFNANIFHPAESTLAYSDHLLPQSVALAPLYALTGDLTLCYNVLLFASFALSGLAMHVFVRAVTGSTAGAVLAGIAWAFWPYRFAHLLHIQLQSLYLLPLAFLFLHRLMAGRRRRDALMLGVVAGLQGLSSVYYAVIGSLGLAVAAVALAIGIGRWRSALIARRLLLAAVVGGALVAPVAAVYWRLQREEGFGRNLFEAGRNAASFSTYAQVPQENIVYGRTGLLENGMLERALFPGLVVLGLAAYGAGRGLRSDARPLTAAMLAMAACGVVLSLGPDGIRDVYALLQRYMFGFQAIRAPARFAILVTFALATLAALGWRELFGRPRLLYAGYAIIAVAAAEYLTTPLPRVPAPPSVTEVGQWLRREPGREPVVHLPIGIDVESTPAMVQSLEHRRPIVNGYSGQRPPFYGPLVDSLSTFPADEALSALKETGARFAVIAPGVPLPDPAVESPLVERARFHDGTVYELRWTPAIESRLGAELAVTPPPPGPRPFAPGEVSRYSVFWEGAGMNVSAGDVTVSVDSPTTFTGRGETAPWMARFFEVHDVFSTRTDDALLPQMHRRDTRQGSRQLTRTFVFSHEERIVRIGREGADAEEITLPLAASARDAISAVFYARTLPLANGDRYLIPVNEGGRNLVVELIVARREPVSVSGRTVPAIRLDPRIRRRIERRRPVTATLWLSDDERRVPVAMDVEAAFGRVRLELVSYQR